MSRNRCAWWKVRPILSRGCISISSARDVLKILSRPRASRWLPETPRSADHSSHRYRPVQIDVLNEVQQPDPFLHGALKCFPPRNQARPAGALVDDGDFHPVGEIVLPRFAARIAEAGAAHVTAGALVAA